MTPQQIVQILFDLMSGKPWSPNSNVTITAPQTMDFQIRRAGESLVVTWGAPFCKVKASVFGIGISGSLTGLYIKQDSIKAIIDGLPDVEFKL